MENNRFSIGQESFAAYGKVNYELGKGMSLEAGARAELVEASLDRAKAPNPAFGIPAVVLKENRHEGYFSPTAGASYQVNENLTAFVRSGLGIKPHGYSAFSDDPATASFEDERKLVQRDRSPIPE